jgi:ATP-dependent Zn protease
MKKWVLNLPKALFYMVFRGRVRKIFQYYRFKIKGVNLIFTLIGKTLLAKAVANQTSATFLRVVGSELIQKYLGDGPKLVRELFRVAEEHAPSIVFIDEIDAIGTKRYDCF